MSICVNVPRLNRPISMHARKASQECVGFDWRMALAVSCQLTQTRALKADGGLEGAAGGAASRSIGRGSGAVVRGSAFRWGEAQAAAKARATAARALFLGLLDLQCGL